MTGFTKILCAVDLSDHSGRVAEYAYSLAQKYSAEVVCVYVAPTLSQYVGFQVPPSSIENFVGEIVSGADLSMEAFIEKSFTNVQAKGKVVTGYAAEEILAVADEEKVDLLVMGTHGRRGLDRMLFGSVAEKVVKSANCPVLTVRPEE
ncbi:MAG: universal stress protein [Desulfovibrio sp.]